MPARYGRAVSRALGRRLAASSVTGISLILGCCAAAWFSAGTRVGDIRGALLLCVGYLALRAAWQLAETVQAGTVPTGKVPTKSMSAGRVLTETVPAGLVPAETMSPRIGAPVQAASVSFARPARACWAAAEYAVYAGLAVGGAADGWRGTWPLAVAALVLVAIRHTMSACWSAMAAVPEPPDQLGASAHGQPDGCGIQRHPTRWMPHPSGSGPPAGQSGQMGARKRLAAGPLRLSAGWRVLLIAVAAPVWGPRAALFGLVIWAIIAIGYAVGSRGPDAPYVPAASAGIAASAGTAASAGIATLTGTAGTGETAGAAAHWRVIAACRDDGAFGRYLGRLVRGQIIPLPPALAGLGAAVMLAVLGLRNLPGMIMLTPLVVMMLAAPGSSHPHRGRFDWLVPALLQAGQYIYLASLGFATGVPAPVTFALCAVTAIWQANLGFGGARRTGLDIGLGWEGRMLVAGLGAAAGLAMFAYLALTAYLGLLICAEIRAGRAAAGEDGRA